jgi:Anti-sigma factor N-terminus
VKKGIVLELDDEFVTLLTPDGEFIQVKKEGKYEIGEEIEAKAVQKPNVRRRSLRYIISFVAAAVLLIATLLHFPSNEVYAYMSIDINPSIEIGVNEQLKVIKLKAYNEEGKKIVSQLAHWQKKAFIDITKEIIELSMKKGYLQKGGQVLITTVERKHRAASSRELSTELTKIQHSYQRKNIVVKTEESTMEVRNEAVKKGMTTGKLLQIEQKTKSVSPKSINMRKQEKPPKQDDKRQINSHFLPEKNEKKYNKNNSKEENEQQMTSHLLQKSDEQRQEGNSKNEKKELQKIYHPSMEKDERRQNKSDDHILGKNVEKQKHQLHDDDLKHHQKKENKQDKHHGKQNYNQDNFKKSPKGKQYGKKRKIGDIHKPSKSTRLCERCYSVF